MSTSAHDAMRTHPDILEMRARYDMAAEQPPAQVADGLLMIAGLYAACSAWIVGFSGEMNLTMSNLFTGLAVALLAVAFGSALARTHGMTFVAPLLGVWLIDRYDPIGIEIPTFVYIALVAVATMFGAWEGGLIGIGLENRKLARFHDDIEAGKFLILIYALREQEQNVARMMRERHPEAEFVGVDRHFVNPFSSPRREPITAPDDRLLQKE